MFVVPISEGGSVVSFRSFEQTIEDDTKMVGGTVIVSIA